jgi:Protein of unknown function (DUF1822)
MTTTSERPDISIELPITQEILQIANNLASQQPNPAKAERSRLNAIAVGIVKNYLEMLDIPTDLRASDSQSAWIAMAGDFADLVLPGRGKLECRPVKAGEDTCYCPMESWVDRVGYVAVILDEATATATIAGFLPSVGKQHIPLQFFQSNEILLKHLAQLNQPPMIHQLSQWMGDFIQTGWQATEALINEAATEVAFALRDSGKLVMAGGMRDCVRRSKVIHFDEVDEDAVVLTIGLFPQSSSGDNPNTQDMSVSITPLNQQDNLPEGIRLVVLEQDGSVLEDISANAEDNFIRFAFAGESGERFGLRVVLQDAKVTEEFQV